MRTLSQKHQFLPSPPRSGGEGAGVRGHSGPHGRARLLPSPPECSTVLRLSRSFALPLWPTSRAPVHRRLPALPPLLVVDRVVRGAALPRGPRGTKGTFTPHPRPLSPSRGEGCHTRFSMRLKNTKSSPRPRNGGEGSGVRGQSGSMGGRGSCRAPLSPQPYCGSAGASHSRYGPQLETMRTSRATSEINCHFPPINCFTNGTMSAS
jgi:hypothetical protein